jgi:diguanylate cyclase (GGDEF)-like protein
MRAPAWDGPTYALRHGTTRAESAAGRAMKVGFMAKSLCSRHSGSSLSDLVCGEQTPSRDWIVLDAFASSELDTAARPLLHLARHVTGFDSSFVCSDIGQLAGQRVVFSVGDGQLLVAEGTAADWRDAAHRAEAGIEAFHALPIRRGDATIGMLCVAGREPAELSTRQLEGLRLIAEALEHLIAVDHMKTLAESRAALAEQAEVDARDQALRHAADSLQMQRLAHTDVLTGLPNRRGFMTRWEEQVARSLRRDTPLALMLIDADNFKKVNDTLGHAMGDAVLRAISASLLVARRTPDIVARLGGDEFALATANADENHLKGLAEEIRQTFAVVAEELGVETTLSIGFVSSETCPRERMLAEADGALYRSKAAGGDTAETIECARS